MTGARAERGRAAWSLLGALAGLALLVSAAAPLSGAWRARAVESAARELAAIVRAESLAAVAGGRDRAILFPSGDGDEPFRVVIDGDGDGVSRDDVARGIDAAGAPRALAAGDSAVRIGNPGWDDVPARPPSRVRLDPAAPAVRFGAERMAVLTADGHATPGSVLVTDDGRFLCSVVVHGATARVRVWCLERRSGSWRLR